MQLHPTSLASGTLGGDAYRFVDWLHDAGQSWWQMLPLGPPDRARSPYKSASAFAAWRGLLAEPAAEVSDDEIDGLPRPRVVLDRAAGSASPAGAARSPTRCASTREWGALRAYAAERGVGLIGDVPIYVAPGGADHRAHPELFRAGEVSGAPPDALLRHGPAVGQPAVRLAGAAAPPLPLVDRAPAADLRALRRHADRPLPRLRRLLGRARGRRRTRAAGAGAAARGARCSTPPRASSAPLPVIAEDLGVITEPVDRLRRELGFPGMVVMQFGFDPDDPHGPHRLEHHEDGKRRLHRHPRPGHAARLVGDAARPRRAAAAAADRRPPGWPRTSRGGR